MRKLVLFFMVVMCAGMVGCGTLAPRTPQELVLSAEYHKAVESNYSYQESIKIIRDDMSDSGIDCIVFSDVKTGECIQHIPQFGVARIGLYIVAREKDNNSSTIDIYAFWKRWLDRGIMATEKLVKK